MVPEEVAAGAAAEEWEWAGEWAEDSHQQDRIIASVPRVTPRFRINEACHVIKQYVPIAGLP